MTRVVNLPTRNSYYTISNFRRLIGVVLLSTLLFSCEKSALEESWVFYTIEKGNHAANENGVNLHTKDKIKFDVFFATNCLYQMDGEDGRDLNKLYGVSDGMNHMANYARFAWRCLDGQNIEIWWFVHRNGEKEYGKFQDVRPDEIFTLEIEIEKDDYLFRMGDRSIRVDRSKEVGHGYRCYPYFGGDNEAPHDMTIAIWEYPG